MEMIAVGFISNCNCSSSNRVSIIAGYSRSKNIREIFVFNFTTCGYRQYNDKKYHFFPPFVVNVRNRRLFFLSYS